MAKATAVPATHYPAVVGRVLYRLRRAAKLEQAQLAASIGVGQSAYSRIELGATAPTVEALALLARTLGGTPGELLVQADRVTALARREGLVVSSARPGGGDRSYQIGVSTLDELVERALA